MGLVLRYSPTENVIRSTGDPPNGVLAITAVASAGEGFAVGALYVTPTWDPGSGTEIQTAGPNIEEARELQIPTDEAVEACADLRTRVALWQFVMGMSAHAVATFCPHGDVETGISVLLLAAEVRDELADRGVGFGDG